MTTLPAAGYFTNAARTNAEAKTGQDDMLEVGREGFGGAAMSELTIAAGSVTPTGGQHSVDTEADAATDDLTNIDQTNTPDGRVLLIRNDTNGRNVVVKHGAGGAGQILLATNQDLTLDDTAKALLLRREGTTWVEVSRMLGEFWVGHKQSEVVSATADPTPGVSDDGKTYACDASGAAFTVTLPAVAGVPKGYDVTVKKTDPSANAVTVDGNGAETIEGRTTVLLPEQWNYVRVVSDGTAWLIDDVKATFESGLLAFTANTEHTVAHGLGVEPRTIETILENSTAEFNYSVGDRVFAYLDETHFTVWADATNIHVLIDTTLASPPIIHNKTTRAQSVITVGSWKIVLKATP